MYDSVGVAVPFGAIFAKRYSLEFCSELVNCNHRDLGLLPCCSSCKEMDCITA